MKIGKFKIMKVERYLGYPAGRVRQWRVTCPICPRHMCHFYRSDFLEAKSFYMYHRLIHTPTEALNYRWPAFAPDPLAMAPDENEFEQFRNEREGRWSI